LPEVAQAVHGMAEQLLLQDEVAQRLRARRHDHGSLEFETLQPHAVFEGERVVAIRQSVGNASWLWPPVEGMLTSYTSDHEVGELLRVKLIHTNVEQAFIDFAAWG